MASKTLVDYLREDETFLTYVRIRKNCQASISVDNITKEMDFLHSTRKIRSLKTTHLSPKRLQDAVLEDLSARSRLVEIRVQVLRQSELISTSMSMVKSHIKATYAEHLRELSGTEAGRTAVIEKFLRRGIQLREELSTLDTTLEILVKDIDQGGFSSRNVLETLKMVLDKREAV